MTLAVQESKCLRDFKKLQKCLSLSRGVFFWNLCCLPAISVFSALVTSLWAESNSRGKQQSPEVMWGCLEQDRVGGVGGRCSPGGLIQDWERCCCDQLMLQEARTYTLTISKRDTVRAHRFISEETHTNMHLRLHWKLKSGMKTKTILALCLFTAGGLK